MPRKPARINSRYSINCWVSALGNVGRPQGSLLRGGIPDLASPDKPPFKTRNGGLTIPAHRPHDLLEVDMYRVRAVAVGTAAAFS